MWIKAEKPVEKQDKLPDRPRKRNSSLLPPGKDTLNASTSGRPKGTKSFVTAKYVLKHRQTTVTTQRRPSPPQSNNNDTNKGAIDPDKK